MSWIERKTSSFRVESLPFDSSGKVALMDPSTIQVYLELYVSPVDVGAWCYRKRKQVVLVDPESFSESRMPLVIAVLEFIHHKFSMGVRETTLSQRLNEINKFILWLDSQKSDDLSNKSLFTRSLSEYTRLLWDDVRASRINVNTASSRQRTLVEIGRYMYSDIDIDLYDDMKNIRKSSIAVNVTEKPDEDLVSRLLRVYMDVFESLSDMVLNFIRFPYKIEVGSDYFWFFPTSVPIAGPSNIHIKAALKNRFQAYDYINGRIKNDYPGRKSNRNVALNNINKANSGRFHNRRIFAATLAAQSFIMLFSASTGMGLGQICELRWSDQYDVEDEVQGFKSIKYRANGKVTSFLISKKFMRLFRRYLDLRNYLLEFAGSDGFERLFFCLKYGDLIPVKMNLSTDFHRRLENCFNFSGKITTRSWRANKNDWLLRNSDLETTSMLLQNSIDSVLKHYSEGSEKDAEEELNEFLNKYKREVVSAECEKLANTNVGRCLEYGSPKLISGSKPIYQPDCKAGEGCLFCERYRVNADLEDYGKILSYQYVLSETRFLFGNDNEEEYLALMSRIKYISEAIEQSGKVFGRELQKVKSLVLQGYNLDPYWEKKLSIIDEMEVLY
ncbi:hypothetical protein FT643_20165 [Ketobacter sp. MCCC 1A13808]|uniref:site-specific integrase n=1 Tax=Ketobacter sp. MCCC 1A13808 TaxID=2602738 RepID=UPI0012EC89CA|nr:site-specific integrase [Ketobacter sp. MCCC 1A13808]MVF14456.1 hypothetical protein [Ketobacter sp. MCCC 1A13808]